MILKVTFRDKTANSGTAGRRPESLTLEAECADDLEFLGKLAVHLVAQGATTAAAVKGLVEKPEPEVPVP